MSNTHVGMSNTHVGVNITHDGREELQCFDVDLGMRTRIIKHLRAAGKWIEFWFEDGIEQAPSFDACCKNYMLWEIVDEELATTIMNTGFRGMAVEWDEWMHRPVRFVPAIGVRHDYLADLSQAV